MPSHTVDDIDTHYETFGAGPAMLFIAEAREEEERS
jgi:hypothetical protein